jgi:O-Antigen ligase
LQTATFHLITDNNSNGPGRAVDLAPQLNARGSKSLLTVLSWITYVSLATFYLADGLIPQVQMFLLGGSTPIGGKYKLVLIGLVLAAFASTRYVQRSTITIATVALIVFLSIDFVVLVLTTQYRAADILNSYRGCLLPLVLFGAVLSVPLHLKESYILRVGFVIFGAALIVSALQYVTDQSVLPIRSPDGTFAVQSPNFFGHIRAFSLFSSGYQAGLFYCLPAAIGAILLLTRRKLLLGSLLLACSSFGSYATLTRLTMFSLVASVLSVIVLLNPRLGRMAKFLPILWVTAAVATIWTSSVGGTASGSTAISSTESLSERLSEWTLYRTRYLSGGSIERFWGIGMSEFAPRDASNTYPSAAPAPIDNTYLQLLLNGGVLSLMVVGFYYVMAWNMLLAKAIGERSTFSLAAAAVFSTTSFVAVFNDMPIALFTLFTIGMMATTAEATPSRYLGEGDEPGPSELTVTQAH